MRYLGLMSGTSVDGIDAVLVAIGPDRSFALEASHHQPYPPATRRAIESLLAPGDNELDRAGELDTILGEAFAAAANTLLSTAGIARSAVRAIGSHGQTVRHRPRQQHPFTVQLANPALIAERTGITTVADFRRRDLAAGGEGAPLVPAFHAWLFHSPTKNRVVLNLGGIANITFIPADPGLPVTGFDTGPANTLLDRWIDKHRGLDHDEDGAWGRSGTIQPDLLEQLLADDYFGLTPPKSTGRERFNLGWLEAALRVVGKPLPPADVQATLVELTVRSALLALERFVANIDEMFVCGGGVHNRYLLERLHAHTSVPVQSTERLGLAPDWVEACAFAWLAHQTLEGLPGNIPSVTGARCPVILGGIYKA